MKIKIVIVSLLLVVGVVLGELSELLERAGMQSKNIYPFKFPPAWAEKDGINNLWWMKYNTDQALLCIVFIVLAMIAHMVSKRLFIIALIFLSYFIVDWYMLWYDFKQNHVTYWIMGVDIIAAVVVLIKVKDGSKIKSII